MWELDCEESWVPKNRCFWTVVLEKTLESPLDCKEIQPVHPKGDQSWVFIGRTDAEAETPILWPPHAKSWLIGKDPDDRGQEEKGTTEDEMVGRHHGLNGHWVWVNFGSWWWTRRPGVLRFMGSQRVGHDWATERNWTEEHPASHLLWGSSSMTQSSLRPPGKLPKSSLDYPRSSVASHYTAHWRGSNVSPLQLTPSSLSLGSVLPTLLPSPRTSQRRLLSHPPCSANSSSSLLSVDTPSPRGLRLHTHRFIPLLCIVRIFGEMILAHQ